MLTASPRKEAPALEVIGEIEKALQHNRYAADLHANLLKLKLETGDTPGAKIELETLRMLVPRSALVKQLSGARL